MSSIETAARSPASSEVSGGGGGLRPRLLIEEWLPIEAVGVECQRERGSSSALPPLYFLHVWWARRPLVAARAAVLGSLLPVWSGGWPVDLLGLFPTRRSYLEWFVGLLGIVGDPVAARDRILEARRSGGFVEHGYDGKRAFTVSPSVEQVRVFRRLCEVAWGSEKISVLDSCAGGGGDPLGVSAVWDRFLGE